MPQTAQARPRVSAGFRPALQSGFQYRRRDGCNGATRSRWPAGLALQDRRRAALRYACACEACPTTTTPAAGTSRCMATTSRRTARQHRASTRHHQHHRHRQPHQHRQQQRHQPGHGHHKQHQTAPCRGSRAPDHVMVRPAIDPTLAFARATSGGGGRVELVHLERHATAIFRNSAC